MHYPSRSVAGALALFLSLWTVAQGAEPLHRTPETIVDDLHSAFDVHPARAVHAKGILLQGSFVASAESKTLSKAPVFDGVSRPVTARFSDFTGFPDISDTAPDASPRGFAFRVHMQAESDVDVVAHSFNGFPVATADDFGALMRAIGESRRQQAKPTSLDRFLSVHPVAKAFMTTQMPPPVSFATLPYFGVNAFELTNASGVSHFVRYRLQPAAGEQYLTEAEISKQGPDYLSKELKRRLDSGPVGFDWFAQLSEPGDVIEDPSRPWPIQRRLVKLGTILINSVVVDAAAVDKDLVFLPGRVPSGIRAADPMLKTRNDTYAISFEGR